MIRLNLGCGDKPLPGFDNLDRKTGQEIYPLAYADESVDEIRASHVLEHFGHAEVLPVLKDWARVLKPGGLMRIAVPNFQWIAENYLAGNDIPVQGYVMGGHSTPDDRHGTIFDKELLTAAMKGVGLVDIALWQSEIQDCAALPVSLNLQGVKAEPLPKLKIGCAMSVPRLGFQDNFFCWTQALMPLGIVPTKFDGAFWDQCLERVMSEILESDFILTIDYDSVFTRESVESLIRLAAKYPEADAIIPVQVKRGGGMPLCTMKDEQGEYIRQVDRSLFDHPLVLVHTGHFGLTLIRTEKLKQMPHPWFLGQPDPTGQWSEGRVDPDIYFWHRWKDAGHSLYLAPRVVIGHGEFMVTWPDQNFEPLYQNPKDFWEKGTPERAWQ
jgi:predicted SAM-dependent methyltransferase